MTVLSRIFFSILLILVFLSASMKSHNTLSEADEGKKLPEISLKDLKGNNVAISELGKSGKITIICFWATWCKPCIKELNNMSELYGDWKEKYDVELYAVSLDDSKTSMRVASVVNAKLWDYNVLLDTNEDLKRAMGVAAPPHTFMTDKLGNIVYEHEGYINGDEYILEEHIEKIFKAEK